MTTLPQSPRRTERWRFSLRGLLLTTAAIALVLGLIIVARSFSVWLSAEVLRRQIASIQASGEPVAFADLVGMPVSRAVNAASFLEQAEEGLATLHDELSGVRQSKPYRAGHPADAELKTIRTVLRARAETILVLEQAARCPSYHPTMQYSIDLASPGLGQGGRFKSLRGAAAALEARSQLQIQDGQLDQALETCLVALRLARLAEQEPFMAGYLLAVASRSVAIRSTNRVLRSGTIRGTGRDALEAELMLHDRVQGYEWMLKTERVLDLETYGSLASSGNRLAQVARNREQSIYLQVFAEHLALSSSTYEDFSIGYTEHRARFRSLPSAGQTFPVIQVAREAMSRTLAEIRCLRLLNAWQRVGNQVDVDPSNLTRLGLPQDALLDPFDGQPLRVKKLPAGWVVYSVGRNGKDDGGAIDPFQDVGVAPLVPWEEEKAK